MTKITALLVGLSLSLVSLTASADPPGSQQGIKVTVLKPITIYGKRPPLPSVAIEIARLSAAHEASEAHAVLHNALVESSLPATLRPQQ